MTKNYALSPQEAAFIAANSYFTLDGWEATYKFNAIHGSGAKGAPAPRPGMASADIVNKNVVGKGPLSVAKAGMTGTGLVKPIAGSSGSNLVGRTRSGFGYILHFNRGGKKHLVIATRGTRPELGYPDLLTDLNINVSRMMPGVGPVHGGFYDVYESVQPALVSARSAILDADVVHCVGHSLGGAVANLVALHCAQLGASVKLYTFGAPRVGLRLAAYDQITRLQLGEENIHRVSHNFDPIPMIPVAPFIHVLPSVKDRNNFFIGSPVTSIAMANHDTAKYIESVGKKTWEQLHTDKLKEGYLDKQYFQSWRGSDSWLKQYLGESLNARMATLQRILQGLIDTVGIGLTEVVTIVDLLAIAVRRGIDAFQVAKNHVLKFIDDCAKMFGMGVEVSKVVLSTLLKKLMTELTIAAKMALATAHRVAKSKEFKVILTAATAGSIGLLVI